MNVEASTLAHLLTKVAVSAEQSAALLTLANELHQEATELHGKIVDAVVELERLMQEEDAASRRVAESSAANVRSTETP